MRIELEEIAGPDHYSSDPALQQWAQEVGSLLVGDQKGRHSERNTTGPRGSAMLKGGYRRCCSTASSSASA